MEAQPDYARWENPMDRADVPKKHSSRGFLNPGRVVSFSFWITTACILVAVVASILAIWEFTGTDALWRTVATCVVVGVGTLAFSWINALFGIRD